MSEGPHTNYSAHPHPHIHTLICMSAKVTALANSFSITYHSPFLAVCFWQVLSFSHHSFVPLFLFHTDWTFSRGTNKYIFSQIADCSVILRQKPFMVNFVQQATLKEKHFSPWLFASLLPHFLLFSTLSSLCQLPRMPCGKQQSGSWTWRKHWGRAWTPLHTGRLCGHRRRLHVFRPRERFTIC